MPFFAVLLFLGSFFEKSFGSELLFLGVGGGLVFFGGFLPMFLFYFWRVAPGSVWKILLMSGLLFSGFVLSSFGFFIVVIFGFCFCFSRDTRTCFAGSFSFCVLPLLSVSPVLAVRSASCWFFGVPFWALRVFGILLELMGLELARPFRGPFLGTRGGRGFAVLLLLGFSFSPFVLRPHFV